MARPKTITDERILDAAAQLSSESGPAFTVADVAARAGVSVGTVSGRFGGKKGLVRGLMRRGQESAVLRIRETGDLREGLLSWFGELSDPVIAANHVAGLGADLLDPELRDMLGELFSAVEKEIRALVRAADLPRAPSPARAARVLITLVNGGALLWSVTPKGTLRTRLAADLDAVLDAWS